MISFELFYSVIIGFLLFNLIGAIGLAYKNYNRKFNLLYLALTCVIIGFFAVDLYFQTRKNCTIPEFLIFEKSSNFFLLVMGIILIQVMSEVTGYSKKWLNRIFTLPLVYFIVINAILPFGFYYSSIERIDTLNLPLGLVVNTPIGKTSANVAFISIYFVLLGMLVSRATMYAFKEGKRSGGMILLIAFIPGLFFQFLSSIVFLLSGAISLPAILLSELGLFYVTLLLGAKNFSDALDLVGVTKSLMESEEKYRLLANHMTDTIWLMDMNLRPYYISPSIEKIRGYSVKELLEMPLEKHFAAGSLAKALDAYKKEMDYLKLHPEHSFFVTLELEFIKKDGSTYWVENTFSLIRDAHGIPSAILAEGRDITFRKIADAKITQLSRAVEQSPVSIIITDTQGVVLYANPKVKEIYGDTRGSRVGEKYYVFDPDLQKENDLDKSIFLQRNLEWKGEIHHRTASGTVVWENVSISPMKDTSSESIQYLVITEDITRRKKLEANLIYEKEKAQEMSRLKTSFLANMSHELRTPMIGILGYSELVIEETKDNNIKKTMEIIYNSAGRLMDTLNLILHLSRVEAGRLDIEYHQFDVIATIQEIIKLFARLAKRKSLYLKLESDCDSLIVMSDEKLLREIISNLINNGIKFTDTGGVTISVRIESTGNYQWLVLIISDTGIGIAKENQELIWEEFRQASEGHSRSFEGTGLGLTITKKFVEKLKGSIVLESDLHKGATFTLRFPIPAIQGGIRRKIKDAGTDIKREIVTTKELPQVLYVEDDIIAVQLVTKILKNVCTIEVVDSSAAALKTVQEKSYAAILMDINLGQGEDGVQATKAIRNIIAYRNTPIVAITAYAMKGDREIFLAAGCSHYISKPFTSEELRKLMSEVLKVV
jgi:PAS domain S-box-containing protein